MIKSKSPAQGPNRRSPRTVLNLASCLLYLWECSLHEKNHYLNSGKVTAFFPATHLRKACPQCSYFLPRKRNSAYGRLPLNPPARILSPALEAARSFPHSPLAPRKDPKVGLPRGAGLLVFFSLAAPLPVSGFLALVSLLQQ